jgi:Chaperone of endosialidase
MKLNFGQAFKKPWVKYSVFGIVGLFVIYFLYKAMAGGSSSTTVTSGTDPVAAQMAMQGAQLAAQQQSQQSGIAASLAGQTNQIQGQIDLAQITSDAQTTQQNNALATQLAIANLTTNAQTEQNNTNVAGQIQLAGIASQNIQQQTTANETVGLAQLLAATQMAQIQSNTMITGATLNANVQNTLSNNALAGQVSNNQTAQAIAAGNNQTAQSSSSDGMWGSIIGGALSLFSDERMKENIVRVGQTDSGLDIYTYNYIGNPASHMGVLAQEAMRKFPDAVTRHESGYLMVNYSKVS